MSEAHTPPPVIPPAEITTVPVENTDRSHPYRAVSVVAGGTAAGATAVLALGSIHTETTGLKSTPVAEIGESIQRFAEVAGPIGIAASAIGVAAFVASKSGRRLWPLASRGLSADGSRTWRDRLRKAGAAIAVPAAGMTALNAAFMIQEEVAEGPNRAVEAIVSGAEASVPTASTIAINWQMGTRHFMESSHIPADTVREVATAVRSGQAPGVFGVIPFKADLTEIPTDDNAYQAGLVLSVHKENGKPSSISPEVRPGALCKVIKEKCVLEPNQAIVDEGEGLNVGDTVAIRGHQVNIVGYAKTPQSLMNRLVMYKGISEADVESGYSGFVSIASNEGDAENMLRSLGLDNTIDPESTQELLQQNKDFWSRNGTPLIMLMVGDTLMLAGFSFAAIRKFEHERNKPQVATLRALGASRSQIVGIQHARIAYQTAQSVIPAAVISKGLELGVNAIMTGFHGHVNASIMGASIGIVLGSQLAAGVRWPKKDALSSAMSDR